MKETLKSKGSEKEETLKSKGSEKAETLKSKGSEKEEASKRKRKKHSKECLDNFRKYEYYIYHIWNKCDDGEDYIQNLSRENNPRLKDCFK